MAGLNGVVRQLWHIVPGTQCGAAPHHFVLAHDEVLQQQEEFIIKKFNESIEYSQILINNLNANKKYKPSEKMKYFETLINTLKV